RVSCNHAGLRTRGVAVSAGRQHGADAKGTPYGEPEDLGDARRRDAHADTCQLANDPLVTRRGLSRARRRTSATRAFVAMIGLFTSVSGEPGPDEQWR